MDRSSFLSDYVRDLLLAGNVRDNIKHEPALLELHGVTIDCEALGKLLAVNYTMSDCNYSLVVKDIAKSGLFYDCKCQLADLEQLPLQYKTYLRWTTKPLVFSYAHSLLRSGEKVNQLLALLLLTSTLDKSLSNVFRTRNKKVPLLLRDLLNAEELELVCGKTYMQLYRILMGPVTSLNVRNIIWHGFAAPGEIDAQYAYTLIVLAASTGKRLDETGVSFQAMDKHSVSHSATAQSNSKNSEEDLAEGSAASFQPSEHRLRTIFEKSRFIPDCMRPIWLAALDFTFSSSSSLSYASTLALIIPAVEHVLRIRFCVANRCPDRLQTSITNVLYTILEDILATQLTERFRETNETETVNRLWLDLGEARMQMLLDLCVYLDGNRLRDRLSHGALDLSAVDRATAIHVLTVAACVCLECENQLENDDLCDSELRHFIIQYESLHHPLSICKQNCVSLDVHLKTLMNLHLQHRGTSITSWSEPFQSLSAVVDHRLDRSTWVTSVTVGQWTRVLDRLSADARNQLNVESRIWMKCTLVLRDAASQLMETAETRLQRRKEMSLSSRVRENLDRMIDFLPIFYDSAVFATACIGLKVSQIVSNIDDSDSTSLLKEFTNGVELSSKLLRSIETLSSLTAANVNRWNDAEQHIRKKFAPFLHDCYVPHIGLESCISFLTP